MQLVSCIMPTSSARQLFIPLAIRYFLRQDYPHTELIIVDDGPQSQESLIPALPQLSYIHVPQKFSSVGAKRNYACSLTKGSIILHWDDDDWYAADWISKQVAALETSGAGIAGLSSLHFLNPARGRSWKYIYDYNNKPWVAGATMAYLKTVWEQHAFPDMQVGEDNEFVWRAATTVQAHNYTEGFVSILHDRNTSPKHTTDRQWKPVPVAEIQRILGGDWDAYSFCHQDPQ
jgi:glycosyltransferase involved in cell wall biosynthesis